MSGFCKILGCGFPVFVGFCIWLCNMHLLGVFLLIRFLNAEIAYLLPPPGPPKEVMFSVTLVCKITQKVMNGFSSN